MTTITDHEMLELAAKAAEIEIDHWRGDNPMVNDSDYDISCYKYWNPLTDDGNALRLAVKLDIDFYMGADSEGPEAWAGYYLPGKENKKHACEPCKNDPYAATRRASVRAAVEIGRNMK